MWAGDGEAPAKPQRWVRFLSMRVIPGKDPDVDPWRIMRGPITEILRPSAECIPKPQEDGWLLSCPAMGPGGLTAFVPAEGESGLEVTIRGLGWFAKASLTKVAQRQEPQASANIELLWHQPGDGLHTDIWAAEGLVYAPRYDGRIEILAGDSGEILAITEPPSEKAEAVDVKARDGLLYAAINPDGLMIFDVSEPTSPELIGQYREGGPGVSTNFHNIFLSPSGSVIYAIKYSRAQTELVVIDVSDPSSARPVGRFSIETDTIDFNLHVAHDMNVIEHDGRLIAFLSYSAAGLWILDVSDPASITVLSSIRWDGIVSHSGWPFTVGRRIYYAHASEGPDRPLTVLDVTDFANPKVLSRFSTRDGITLHNVEVVDGIAYISYFTDGLRVVDLREPENPREVAHFDTVIAENERSIIQGAWGVRVLEDVVHVSDIETGTYAFKVNLE